MPFLQPMWHCVAAHLAMCMFHPNFQLARYPSQNTDIWGRGYALNMINVAFCCCMTCIDHVGATQSICFDTGAWADGKQGEDQNRDQESKQMIVIKDHDKEL